MTAQQAREIALTARQSIEQKNDEKVEDALKLILDHINKEAQAGKLETEFKMTGNEKSRHSLAHCLCWIGDVMVYNGYSDSCDTKTPLFKKIMEKLQNLGFEVEARVQSLIIKWQLPHGEIQ